MALTTLSDLKLTLGITDSTEDSLLTLLITQVSNFIEEYCGRTFASTSYTEYYCGNNQPFIVLNQRPVTAIASVYLDDNALWGQAPLSFAAGTLLTAGVDYALDIDQPDGSSRSGRLYNANGYWDAPFTHTPGIITSFLGPFKGNIKITYTAGYSSVPTALALECNMAIAKIRQMAQYGMAIASQSYEEYSIAFMADAQRHMLSPEVRSVLARYRNIAVA